MSKALLIKQASAISEVAEQVAKPGLFSRIGNYASDIFGKGKDKGAEMGAALNNKLSNMSDFKKGLLAGGGAGTAAGATAVGLPMAYEMGENEDQYNKNLLNLFNAAKNKIEKERQTLDAYKNRGLIDRILNKDV